MGKHNVTLCVLVAAVVSVGAAVRDAAAQDAGPTGSSAASETAAALDARYPIFAIDAVAVTPVDAQLVGREVVADGVEVKEVIGDRFWVSANDGKDRVLIVPAEGSLISVRSGESVNVHGEVRLVRIEPHRNDARGPGLARMAACVYAYTVRPAW